MAGSAVGRRSRSRRGRRWWSAGDHRSANEGRTEQAHDEVEQVQQEAEGDGLLRGHAERSQEEHEQAFADAETEMLIGSTWAMATAGKKASSAVGPAASMPSARAAMTAATDQGELVRAARRAARWPPGRGAGAAG